MVLTSVSFADVRQLWRAKQPPRKRELNPFLLFFVVSSLLFLSFLCFYCRPSPLFTDLDPARCPALFCRFTNVCPVMRPVFEARRCVNARMGFFLDVCSVSTCTKKNQKAPSPFPQRPYPSSAIISFWCPVLVAFACHPAATAFFFFLVLRRVLCYYLLHARTAPSLRLLLECGRGLSLIYTWPPSPRRANPLLNPLLFLSHLALQVVFLYLFAARFVKETR